MRILCAVAVLCAAACPLRGDEPTSDEPLVVAGKTDGAMHVWEHGGEESPEEADVGKPDGRLVVKAKKGDVVRFQVDSGTHGVLFEKAKAEMDDGVWKVTAGPETLGELPNIPGTSAFDRDNARTTPRRAPSGGQPVTLLEITIGDLKPGPENGILFGCNPHSFGGNGQDRMMLGVIVLDDGEASPEGKAGSRSSK